MESIGIHLEPLRAILFQIGAFLPRLLLGLVIVLVGWLVAKVVRLAVIKALRAFNFNLLFERSGLDGFLRQGGAGSDTTAVFGGLAYWLTIVVSLFVASSAMGLGRLTDLLGRVIWFLPNVFVALLVLAFGAYFARFVGGSVTGFCRSAKMPDAVLLGKVAQYLVMAFVILVALDQTRIGGDIIRQSFLVILAGVVFALALAFGLGARDWAADRIESWWPREKKAGPPGEAARPGQTTRPASGP